MPAKYQFERVYNTTRGGSKLVGDEVRVGMGSMSIGRKAYERMGHPESLTIEVSKDKVAIHLIQNGDFRVISKQPPGRAPYFYVNIPVALRSTVKRGRYRFTEDNIFVLIPGTAVE